MARAKEVLAEVAGEGLGPPADKQRVVLYGKVTLSVACGAGGFPNLDLGSHLASFTNYVPQLVEQADEAGKEGYIKVPWPGTYLITAYVFFAVNTGTSRYVYIDGYDSDSLNTDSYLSPGYSALITGSQHWPVGTDCPAFDIIAESPGSGATTITGAEVCVTLLDAE